MDRDSRPIGECLRGYLSARGMPLDSGVAQRWVWVRFLGVPIAFPNFDARRAILVLHDVHHLLTGYDTTWRGEAEIGGFEIASGCGRLWAAWLFNGGGFLFGLAIAPRRTFRGFVRGRHCGNFYGRDADTVLRCSVADARRQLGLDRPVPAAALADRLAFAAAAAAVVLLYVLVPLALLAAVAGHP